MRIRSVVATISRLEEPAMIRSDNGRRGGFATPLVLAAQAGVKNGIIRHGPSRNSLSVALNFDALSIFER